ncbi:LysR substrate-binding domain-containing protein [Saccharospirillum salsuginis]|uniref:Transcriptional regulator GcvA n=1 Tax=Saccharospirillum salsuginis TaxID=418750 RepID=A0A918KJQ1_9GAMM|nr:LysR substrate-binding domain-containing protein [Saccharospirillum salsuginis]GGX66039.1 transcriptional regulator GcvA [Saccharospirillum salsuginis]
MKRLPSLQTIQAFEASIRHGSFTRAAEELHLTHGAISRHVQKLEDWYGKALFERQGPRVRPTVAGEGLRQRLLDPLHGLYQALETPVRPRRDALYLSTLVSIAQTWILPNLDDFKQQCPNIDLTVATDYQVLSIPPASKVVALRFGQFDHRGLFAEKLLDESMVAVASPAWLARHGADPAHWPTEDMVVHTATPWPATLKTETGVTRLPLAQGARFNDAQLCLQAAAHGMGVAWTRSQMARTALERGDLVAIEPLRQQSDRSYWLVCREELIQDPTLVLFRRWIHDVIGGV